MSKMRAAPFGSGGFTLIEVMIALTLLGLLMSVLFSGLRLGASSWDRAEEVARRSADRAQIGAFLQRHLERAEPVFISRADGRGERLALAFDGRPDRLSWVAALPAHRGGGGLHWMSLDISRSGQGEGLVLEYRLWHPDTIDNAAEPERQLLLEGVESLGVEFLGIDPRDGIPVWTDSWQDRTELPRLVRLRVQHGADVWPEIVVAPRQGMGETLRITGARR